jgi:hypothetical protein
MMTLTQDPEDLKILTSLALMNIEGEGMGDVRRFYRKRLVSMGAVEPTEEERAELEAAAQQQKPDPQAAFLESEAQKNMSESQAHHGRRQAHCGGHGQDRGRDAQDHA